MLRTTSLHWPPAPPVCYVLTARLPTPFQQLESQPRATRFRTQRQSDPVDPRYSLPRAEAPPPAEAPFKRDLHQIGDIAGTSSNAFLRYSTRDHFQVGDIAGTSSRARTVIVQGLPSHAAHADSLRVKDINDDGLKPVGFRSRRRTDELNPQYVVHGRVVHDDDRGMFVRGPPRGAGVNPFLPLTTEDIDGAKAGRSADVTVGGIPADKRRFWGVTNNLADVPGAQVGSRAPGLTTVRMTDPNERDYVLLDGRRWNAEELAVGKSWYNAAATILAAEAGDMAATMPFGRTGIAAAVAPAHDYSKRVLDPRDAELARMRGELETLRREREVLTLSSKLAAVRGARAVTAGASAPSGETGLRGRDDKVAQRANAQDAPSPLAEGASLEAAAPASRGAAARAASVDLSSTIAPPRDASDAERPPLAPKHAGPTATALGGTRPATDGSASHAGRHVEYDPIQTLRSRLADANARNVLGVIPATRPPQDLTGMLATIREATGRYDSRLDGFPAAPRGKNIFAERSGGHMAAGAFRDATAARQVARERQINVADVRALS